MRDRTEYSSESNLQQRNNSLSLLPQGLVLMWLHCSYLFILISCHEWWYIDRYWLYSIVERCSCANERSSGDLYRSGKKRLLHIFLNIGKLLLTLMIDICTEVVEQGKWSVFGKYLGIQQRLLNFGHVLQAFYFYIIGPKTLICHEMLLLMKEFSYC